MTWLADIENMRVLKWDQINIVTGKKQYLIFVNVTPCLIEIECGHTCIANCPGLKLYGEDKINGATRKSSSSSFLQMSLFDIN